MQNLIEKVIKKLNIVVSGFLVVIAISLVIFMVVQLGFIIIDLWHNIHLAFYTNPTEMFSTITHLSVKYLHIIALMILLVKAYKIVTSYADDHHVDIRYMIEIAIIGSILELLFNASGYTPIMQIVFTVLALGSAVIYHYWYSFEGEKKNK